MFKVWLTWQKDRTHSRDYAEEVFLGERPEEPSVDDQDDSSHDSDNCEEIIQKLDRAVMAVAFNECLQQLNIIQSYLNKPVKPWWNELPKYKTLDERFTYTGELKEEFEQEEYEKIEYTDEHKIQKELCLIIVTLKESIREIIKLGTFGKILGVLDVLNKEFNELKNLENKTTEYTATYHLLNKRFSHEKKKFNAEMLKVVTNISDLKAVVDDVEILTRTEYKYINSWENARLSQHRRTLAIEEDVFNNNITSCDQKKEYESRIHKEIEDYLLENTEDLRNDIQYWMQEYDNEVERLDDAIIFVKGKWEALTDEHQKLIALYQEHKEACEQWIEHKEEQRRIAELELKRNKAAVKIQAWWRGTMYRKKLGPYRKKKKKGKGKDKKKGKKK